MQNRREFLQTAAGGAAGLAAAGLWPALARGAPAAGAAGRRPNVVVVFADDLGWRDVGYQGSPQAKTPNLDEMAAHGVRFDYFYAAQQMCSPGRFALLTGRTPLRVGLHHLGAMRPQEITIAKALKTAGYRTAHFGKWHLGDGATHPLRMGFDRSYYSSNYFDIGGKLAVDDTKESVAVQGDSSVFTMDLALDWIRKAAADTAPFFAYVCFGSPHGPHQGAPEFKALYPDAGNRADFLAEISGVDAAVGRLRAALRELGIADDTLVWFTSDNGGTTPQSKDPAGLGKMDIGARTAACLEWPARVPQPIRTDCACVHMDLYPTVLEVAGVTMPDQPVLDGISLVPLLDGKMARRPSPMGFMLWGPGKGGKGPKQEFAKADFARDTRAVWIDGAHKLVVEAERRPAAGAAAEGAATAEPAAPPERRVRLLDIYADPAEKSDLAAKEPERVAQMRRALEDWQRSVRASYDGKDYPAARPVR